MAQSLDGAGASDRRSGAEHAPSYTLFTRFIPPVRADDMPGTWQAYYRQWAEATQEHLDPRLLELMPHLQRLIPPATVFDKPVYSAFMGHRLLDELRARQANTLIVTGSETDMCVLATVLGAVDHGFGVVLVSDGLCSSSDEGHDTLLALYRKRFSEQIDTATSEEILAVWRPLQGPPALRLHQRLRGYLPKYPRASVPRRNIREGRGSPFKGPQDCDCSLRAFITLA